MPIEVVHLTHCYSEGSALRTVAHPKGDVIQGDSAQNAAL